MRIFNFGSLNVDRVYGVREFVRAGETIQSQSYREFPGGKGLNQSIAAARAGAKVVHVGAVGTDGGLLTDALKQEDVSLHLHRLPCATGHAVIQVNPGGQNAILVHPGANASMEETWVTKRCATRAAGRHGAAAERDRQRALHTAARTRGRSRGGF